MRQTQRRSGTGRAVRAKTAPARRKLVVAPLAAVLVLSACATPGSGRVGADRAVVGAPASAPAGASASGVQSSAVPVSSPPSGNAMVSPLWSDVTPAPTSVSTSGASTTIPSDSRSVSSMVRPTPPTVTPSTTTSEASTTQTHAASPAPTTATSSSTARTYRAADLEKWRWTSLPASPLTPDDTSVAVWTGTEMIVWGGRIADSVTSDHAAAYDPVTRNWRLLPPAPISAGYPATALWTGRAVLVWNGTAGASYDPQSDTWAALPEAPVNGPGSMITAVWTGAVVVLISDTPGKPAESKITSAVYDPAVGSWRSLPDLTPPPRADFMDAVVGVADGDTYLWAHWSDTEPTGSDSTEVTAGYLHDRLAGGTSQWVSTKLDAPDSAGISETQFDGHDFLVPGAYSCGEGCSTPGLIGLENYRVNPTTGVAVVVPHGPADDYRPLRVWTGGAWLAYGGVTCIGACDSSNPTAAWDPGSDKWIKLDDMPSHETELVGVWTGHSVLALGSFWHGQSAPQTTGGLQFGP